MQRLLLLLISTVLLSAQAPPDSTAYSVAYVDIVPASRTAAITAIKQYRDASRKDDGFQRIEFFEQAGRPAHVCIIETWANNKDLDTHAASANAKDFRSKIDSMRLSDYDQRPYKALSLFFGGAWTYQVHLARLREWLESGGTPREVVINSELRERKLR